MTPKQVIHVQYGGNGLYHPTGIWAVGDIHGDLILLRRIVEEILRVIRPGEHIVFCGDYINGSGGDNVGVLEYLAKLQREYPAAHFIMGNHEEIFLAYLRTPAKGMMETYGKDTLDEMENLWGLETRNPVPLLDTISKNGILSFLQRLIPYYETPSVLISHAPFDLVKSRLHGLAKYEADLSSGLDVKPFVERLGHLIRWQFVDEKTIIPWITKFRIAGHQYSHNAAPRIFKHSAFIDTGCGLKAGKKKLTAIHWPSKKYIQAG
jgi:hypothetical protein